MTTPRTPEGVIAAALNQVFVNQRQQVMTSAANVVDAIMRALTSRRMDPLRRTVAGRR